MESELTPFNCLAHSLYSIALSEEARNELRAAALDAIRKLGHDDHDLSTCSDEFVVALAEESAAEDPRFEAWKANEIAAWKVTPMSSQKLLTSSSE